MLETPLASCGGTHHSTQQSKPSSWVRWKDQRERTELPQIPFKNSSFKGLSETLKTLIYSGCHSQMTICLRSVCSDC